MVITAYFGEASKRGEEADKSFFMRREIGITARSILQRTRYSPSQKDAEDTKKRNDLKDRSAFLKAERLITVCEA